MIQCYYGKSINDNKNTNIKKQIDVRKNNEEMMSLLMEVRNEMETSIAFMNKSIKELRQSMDKVDKYIEDIKYENITNEKKDENDEIDDDDIKLKEWLKKLKLEQYFNLLIENGIDSLDILMQLTDKNLKNMGIKKIGHLIKLSNGIDKLWNKRYKPVVYQSYESNPIPVPQEASRPHRRNTTNL